MRPSPMSPGLLVAVVAAVSFGVSGSFAEPLLDSGWSPAAAVTVRATIGGAALLPFALAGMVRRRRDLWRARWRIVAMAGLGVAGAQVCFFSAITRIPVSTAILVEYMAPIVLVLAGWGISRRRPALVVLAGSAAAVAGLCLVVTPSGAGIDPIGVLIALGATVCLSVFFVVAAQPSEGVAPIAMAAVSLLLAAAVLAVLGTFGVLPISVSTDAVQVVGQRVPWWVPVLVIGLVATAVAYATSISASRLLGARVASFAGLLEVVAAAVFAWILIGQALSVSQIAGGVLILVGIALVQADRSTVGAPRPARGSARFGDRSTRQLADRRPRG